jgi:hypothetical protein
MNGLFIPALAIGLGVTTIVEYVASLYFKDRYDEMIDKVIVFTFNVVWLLLLLTLFLHFT